MPVIPEFSLEGRSAILATSGGDESPGLAVALAEAGASVFTITRTRPLLESVLDALSAVPSANGGGTAADVSTMSGLARAMGAFDQVRRPVDILVNDARSMFAKPFDQITYAEWHEVQSRNLGAAFLLTQEVSRRMVERGYGRVVNLVSVLAERGMINGFRLCRQPGRNTFLDPVSRRGVGAARNTGERPGRRLVSPPRMCPWRYNGRNCWCATLPCAAKAARRI